MHIMNRKITFRHSGLRSERNGATPWYRIVSSPCLEKGVAYPQWSMFVTKEEYDAPEYQLGQTINVSLFYTKVA